MSSSSLLEVELNYGCAVRGAAGCFCAAGSRLPKQARGGKEIVKQQRKEGPRFKARLCGSLLASSLLLSPLSSTVTRSASGRCRGFRSLSPCCSEGIWSVDGVWEAVGGAGRRSESEVIRHGVECCGHGGVPSRTLRAWLSAARARPASSCPRPSLALPSSSPPRVQTPPAPMPPMRPNLTPSLRGELTARAEGRSAVSGVSR